ncbi:hypothetical protein BJY24_004975 [Nocardia transvalensis]|uniref:Uncharacterized protein n=1 Tax=Nocardia transvalensis TaxID=37333 RepID=A0A7W9PI15_9NOCA|nr:hypothetical protein [Nocardia transvalensis]
MGELSSEKPEATKQYGPPATSAEDRLRVKRVQIWATAGGLLLALQVYVWVRWISGPYFERVPGGPADPPMDMKAFLTMNAVVVCAGGDLVVPRQAVAPGTPDHPRRHPAGVHGVDVLPGPAAELR